MLRFTVFVLSLMLSPVGFAQADGGDDEATDEATAASQESDEDADAVDQDSIVSDPAPLSAGESEEPDNLTDEQAIAMETSSEAEVSDQDSDFIDMNISLFRRWYNDAPFTLEGLLLSSEWSIPSLPIRIGPSMRYSQIKSLDNYYSDGQMIDFSLRVTTFADFENILPYISVDYTLGGLGTVRANQRIGNTEESGTVDFKSTGFDLIVGASYFWSHLGIFFETTVYSEHNVELSGNITQAEVDQNGDITFNVKQPEDYKKDSYLAFALGLSVEL